MSKFSQERRDALKSTCRLVTVTALASGAGVKAFAAGGAMPLPQSKGVPQVGDTFVFSAGPNKGKEVMVADVVLGARPLIGGGEESEHGQAGRRRPETTITPPFFSTGWRRIAIRPT